MIREKADLKKPADLKFGQKATLPGAAVILSRFPKLS